MKKVSVVIGSIVIATIVTCVSAAVVRTTTSDVCHVYDEAGFPLSFGETLQTQPDNDQCASAALSKSHPTYSMGNLAIDWLLYFALSTTVAMVIRKRKRRPQPSASPELK